MECQHTSVALGLLCEVAQRIGNILVVKSEIINSGFSETCVLPSVSWKLGQIRKLWVSWIFRVQEMRRLLSQVCKLRIFIPAFRLSPNFISGNHDLRLWDNNAHGNSKLFVVLWVGLPRRFLAQHPSRGVSNVCSENPGSSVGEASDVATGPAGRHANWHESSGYRMRGSAKDKGSNKEQTAQKRNWSNHRENQERTVLKVPLSFVSLNVLLTFIPMCHGRPAPWSREEPSFSSQNTAATLAHVLRYFATKIFETQTRSTNISRPQKQ